MYTLPSRSQCMRLQRLRLRSHDQDGEELPQDIWDGFQWKDLGCAFVGESYPLLPWELASTY